jgi:sulfide dehydrogenase [flavocytochrome c] flavoprotein subunit
MSSIKSSITRRQFIKVAGGMAALGLAGFPMISRGAKAQVVVVGGGYGGAIAAKYLRLADPDIDVVLIEKDAKFISCPLSNEVLGGERDLASLTFTYEGLASHGVKIVNAEVTEIDTEKHKVRTKDGQSLDYARLILSPGIAFKFGAIEGYDQAAAEIMPHAWKAGPQTLLLRQQIEAMPDGGKVIIVAPPNPFRCPPGPYERAAQIAHYLKSHNKPKCKIIILDAKDAFSKRGLFQAGWEQHYPGMITWVSGSNDGKVVRVEPKEKKVFTEFDTHQADVVNVIPPQKAADIAASAGLVDSSGWCPVDPKTFKSTLRRGIHVIGDACIAGEMPKSGYAASSQGKAVAAAVAALVSGKPVAEPSFINTCYSLITPDHGISVAGVYQIKEGKIVSVKDSGGVSPAKASAWDRKVEALHAISWFRNITADMFI